MRKITFCLLGFLFLVMASCGSTPTPPPGAKENPKDTKAKAPTQASNKKDSEAAGAKDPGQKEKAGDLAALFLGRWQRSENRFPVLGVLFASEVAKELSAGKTLILTVHRKGHLTLTTENMPKGFAPSFPAFFYANYRFLSHNALEIIQTPTKIEAVLIDGKYVVKEEPLKKKKIVIHILEDQLKIADDQGNVENYHRLPFLPAHIKITHLPLYSDSCTEILKKALAKVEGLSDLSIEYKGRTVTFKIKDENEKETVAAVIAQVGMCGATKINDEPWGFKPGGVITGQPPSREIVLEGVHACCPECQKIISALLKGAKVTFEGDGPTKTVRIVGDLMDPDLIRQALGKAGFKVFEPFP